MKNHFGWFLKNPVILQPILRLSKKKKVKLYIVGGILRDILLGREKTNPDVDFCLKKRAIPFARSVADALKAGFFILDKPHGSARVVKSARGKIYTLDFTDFRGDDIKSDLYKRDFTINAIASEFDNFRVRLIDPFGGQRDLKKRIIRLVNKDGLDEDPLRILRAFSLSSLLSFKIDDYTIRSIESKKNKLIDVSRERVRDELFKILSAGHSYKTFAELGERGIMDLIIPEIIKMKDLNQGPYHHLDVWDHSLETLRHMELILGRLRDKKIREYLDEEISPARPRWMLVKFAALLHDIGKPDAIRVEDGKIKFYGHERLGASLIGEIGDRLKLSSAEIGTLRLIVRHHLRPGYLSDHPRMTPRSRFKFFRDTGKEAVSVLLVSLCDERATRGTLTTEEMRLGHERAVRRLIKEYFSVMKKKKGARIITGYDLMRQFKLKPSPLIGRMLKELDESLAIGKIRTKREALKEASGLLKSMASAYE